MQTHDSAWFNFREIEEGILLIEEPGHVQFYLVQGLDRAALVDTGMGFKNILEAIAPFTNTPVFVLNTHWHFDHIGGNPLFSERGIAQEEEHLVRHDIPNDRLMDLYIRPCLSEGMPFPHDFDPSSYRIQGLPPTFVISSGGTFDLGGRKLLAIATPGHTCGSMSFLEDRSRSLIAGDLVCEGAIYAHFRDSDVDEYIASLELLLARHKDFDRLLVSHGAHALPPEFLRPVLEGFNVIRSRTDHPYAEEGWGEPVERHDFQGFSILSKPPGSRGIKLFA